MGMAKAMAMVKSMANSMAKAMTTLARVCGGCIIKP